MFRRSNIRTGIDIGSRAVKLMRVDGRGADSRITHVGVEPIEAGEGDASQAAAASLKRLLKRLDLRRATLGRVAVSIGGPDVRLREAALPPLSEKELAQALPFEARKHLDIDDLQAPILDAQILGTAPAEDDSLPEQTRVLFAATSRKCRQLALDTLAAAGIEPEVIDAEPLATLNAVATMFASQGSDETPPEIFAVLDVGAGDAQLHMCGTDGHGFVSRQLGSGLDSTGTDPSALARQLAARARETFTFYRAKHRRDAQTIYLAGGAALSGPFVDSFEGAWKGTVNVLDPLGEAAQSARGLDDVTDLSSQFVTARGLCTRMDGSRV